MKLAANLTYLFADAPVWERIDRAADAGFEGVEFLQPYDEDASDLRHTLEAAGPVLVLINTPEPDWAAGGRGHAAVPGAEESFARALETALDFARDGGAGRIHLLAGRAEGPGARAAYVANLARAADAAPDMAFTIEPLNPVDQPGYFLAGFEQAAEILDEVDRPNLGLQFDTCHAARIAADAGAAWDRCRARVTHVQIADADRRAPGRSEIALVERMLADGYAGWISAEYMPDGATEDGLDWMRAFA